MYLSYYLYLYLSYYLYLYLSCYLPPAWPATCLPPGLLPASRLACSCVAPLHDPFGRDAHRHTSKHEYMTAHESRCVGGL